MVDQFVLASRGVGDIQRDLHTPSLRNVLVPIPPPEDQAAIVKYLAHANARIDKAIAAKRRLIALLRERSDFASLGLVTDALESSDLSVSSGYEWLGDVPHTWKKLRAKVVLEDVDERSTTGQEEVLSVSHLTGVTPRSEKQITMFEAQSYVGHKLCKPGDLVVNTMWAWMGALGVARHHGIVSPAYNVYRPRRDGIVDVEFLARLLRSRPYNDMFRMFSTGIRPSRLRFYPDQLLATPLFLPALDDQREIVRRISDTATEARNATARVGREIRLLEEFRARLVADVVTGQVDTRAVSPSLPDADLAGSAIEAPTQGRRPDD